MLPLQLDSIDAILIQQLCDEGCPESQTLDFKRDLPAHDDKGRHEFLKDVCALANSSGGDLVYGVEENSGAAKAITPCTAPADATQRRLGQILDAGIEPRLQGVQFKEIAVTGGYVLIVRVPASFDGPHRYLFNSNSKFVMRSGTYTAEHSYTQLRDAFDRTATLVERAGRFRAERVQAITDGKTFAPLVAGPTCVMHFIPISAMAGRRSVAVNELYTKDFTQFMFRNWSGGSRSLNLDGLAVYPGHLQDENDRMESYVQLFRSGAIEAVTYGGSHHPEFKNMISAPWVSAFYREALEIFIHAAKRLNFSGPAIAGASMLSVGGHSFSPGERYFMRRNLRADRDHLVMPEVWIENVEAVSDVDAIARPVLDVLWQSFDIERCMMYDESNNWKSR